MALNFTNINLSALNLTEYAGGLDPIEAQKYVRIETCISYINQTTFWMYTYAILFLVVVIMLAYFLYKNLKLKKETFK